MSGEPFVVRGCLLSQQLGLASQKQHAHGVWHQKWLFRAEYCKHFPEQTLTPHYNEVCAASAISSLLPMTFLYTAAPRRHTAGVCNKLAYFVLVSLSRQSYNGLGIRTSAGRCKHSAGRSKTRTDERRNRWKHDFTQSFFILATWQLQLFPSTHCLYFFLENERRHQRCTRSTLEDQKKKNPLLGF